MRDGVPADPLAHFVLDAVDALDLRQVKVNTRGTGDAQYPPTMLLGRLIYSYATGTFGSRRMEQSTFENIAVRLITADTPPDQDTIGTFRRENQALLSESFGKVLQLAQALPLAQFGQITVSLDGTKIAANASKHAAVSDERAGQRREQREGEVRQRLAQAEQADATPLQDGLTIPGEIGRRQERKAALEQARAEIETRAQARYALEWAEHEKKLAARVARQQRGEKPPEPAAPAAGASGAEVMRHRLKTTAGKALYKLRQQTVAPVFGIIKAALGFRPFLWRGLAKVSLEWTRVTLAYNLKRLPHLGTVLKMT